MILTGPSEEPNTLNIVHEYLHGITHPVTGQLIPEISKTSDKVEEVKNTIAYKQGYTDWNSIVEESFVRALSLLAVENYDLQYNETYLDREVSKG